MTDGPLVILIGAPGSGKTKIGRRVAKYLGVPFCDSDKLIVAEYGAISDIFAEHGEPHFRQLERAIIERALGEAGVLSVGGGAVMHPETRAAFAKRRVVRLTVSPEAVEARITGGKRPLLGGGVEVWKQLVAQREPVYSELAQATWDTSARPLDTIAQEIADWVRSDAAEGDAVGSAARGGHA